GVAARVGGVVVRAVVVDRPVQELEVTVRAPGVQIEEIGQVELTQAKFDPARGEGCSKMKLVAVGFDALIAERNDLPQHNSRNVGVLTEGRVAHDIEIRDTGESEGIAEAVAARAFDIEEDFGGGRELVAEI